MKVGRKDTSIPEINVGAFSDIAFLLIIFFILTTTFVKPAGQKLSIPSGTSDPEQKEQKQLSVTLTRNDIYYGDSTRPVEIDELRRRLLDEKFPSKDEDQRIVVLVSDPNVPYERYFQVVMAITRAGGVIGMLEGGNQSGGGT